MSLPSNSPLLPLAIAGTASVPSLPPSDHPTSDAIARGESVPQDLLRRVGAESLYRQLGRPSVELAVQLPPIVSYPDDLPPLPEAAWPAFRAVLEETDGEAKRLGGSTRNRPLEERPLEPLLELITAVGYSTPPPFLEEVASALRWSLYTPLAHAALGRRGRWFASLFPNLPDYDPTAPPDLADLPPEQLHERLADGRLSGTHVLHALLRRDDDPEFAQLLAALAAINSPSHVTLLERIQSQLDIVPPKAERDASFETLLRSLHAIVPKKRRPTVGALLAQLPQTDVAAATREWALDRLEPPGRGKKRLVVVGSKQPPAFWLPPGDELDPKESYDLAGDDVLTAAIRTVPLQEWTQRFDRTPAELVALLTGKSRGTAADEAARRAVLRGWVVAAGDRRLSPLVADSGRREADELAVRVEWLHAALPPLVDRQGLLPAFLRGPFGVLAEAGEVEPVVAALQAPTLTVKSGTAELQSTLATIATLPNEVVTLPIVLGLFDRFEAIGRAKRGKSSGQAMLALPEVRTLLKLPLEERRHLADRCRLLVERIDHVDQTIAARNSSARKAKQEGSLRDVELAERPFVHGSREQLERTKQWLDVFNAFEDVLRSLPSP